MNAWSLEAPEWDAHADPPPLDYLGFTYGFCRNPWDRVVSLYFKRVGPRGYTFIEWVLAGMPVRPDVSPTLLLPCAHWLRNADWVGRFEQRGIHVAALADLLNRPIPQRWDARGPRREYHWTAYYIDQDARRYVGARYHEDIDLYGYTFGQYEDAREDGVVVSRSAAIAILRKRHAGPCHAGVE